MGWLGKNFGCLTTQELTILQISPTNRYLYSLAAAWHWLWMWRDEWNPLNRIECSKGWGDLVIFRRSFLVKNIMKNWSQWHSLFFVLLSCFGFCRNLCWILVPTLVRQSSANSWLLCCLLRFVVDLQIIRLKLLLKSHWCLRMIIIQNQYRGIAAIVGPCLPPNCRHHPIGRLWLRSEESL